MDKQSFDKAIIVNARAIFYKRLDNMLRGNGAASILKVTEIENDTEELELLKTIMLPVIQKRLAETQEEFEKL